jgi:hypothetical protein
MAAERDSKGRFVKGHDPYFINKQVTQEKFLEVWEDYRFHLITVEEASRRLGITRATFLKWRIMLFENDMNLEGLDFIKGQEGKR